MIYWNRLQELTEDNPKEMPMKKHGLDFCTEAKLDIIRSNRKTMAIQITPDGILLRVPAATSDREALDFLRSKRGWVEKHYVKTAPGPGGRKEPPFTWKEIRELAQKALEVIPQRVRYYAPLIGVTYGTITIRNQRSRWGSCSSKGNLNFNCLLMLFPPEIIDSVVVHELCHRKHMDHSPNFYAEVYKVMPDYDRYHRILKDRGPALIARLP